MAGSTSAQPASAPEVRPVAHAGRPRRNPRWIAAGLAAMCLGGVGSVALWTQAAGSTQVLQLAHAVQRGEVLDADDLLVVTVGRMPDGAAVPAAQREALLGKQARADLPAGSLLAPSAVGDPLSEDGVLVGLRLAPGRIPAQTLPRGAVVMLIPVQSGAPQPGAAQAAEGPGVAARVVTETRSLPDGHLVIDVAVAPADAARVARLAALDQLTVVREAGR